jgi:adenylate kinase
MKFVMLGPPGSGKGTVAERLAKDFNIYTVSAGALLREEIKKGTTLGKDLKKFVESGDLVPDQFVVELIKLDVKEKKDFILDGFPRTLEQAKSIESLNLDAAILLDVPEEVLVERFSGRRIDPVTQKGYHLKYIPPPPEIIPHLIQRDDDKPEVVRERFKIYRQKTQPLIDYYRKKGVLETVDGSPAPEEVYAQVKKIVSKYISSKSNDPLAKPKRGRPRKGINRKGINYGQELNDQEEK